MRGLVQLKEDDTLDLVDYTRSDIDWIYEIPEDGTISIQDTDIQDREVKKDDMVILFYKREGQAHRAIIINNAEWKENIKGIREAEAETEAQLRQNLSGDHDGPCCDCEAKSAC